jgi:hypothetical protein
MKYLLVSISLMLAGGAVYPAYQKVQRLPMQKKQIELKSPTGSSKQVAGYDKKTGEPIYVDPRPRIVVLDAKSGKYGLRWVGRDGNEKMIVYQRPDAIDAVVSASVSTTTSGEYTYLYNIRNLPSSGQHLSGFAVQNFASDVKARSTDDIHVGQMTNLVKEFKNGNWIRYGILSSFTPLISAGRQIEFKLESSSPPGLVECRAQGGKLGMKGVGEEPPQELANVLPGYEAWPSGYTIGPVEKLKTFPPQKRAKYIRKRLLHFQRLGWMSADSLPWYQRNLRGDQLEQVYNRAAEDLKAGKITTEVLAMIQSIEE